MTRTALAFAGDDEPMDHAEVAEKAAVLSASGLSPREVAAEMGLEDTAAAERYIAAGKLAVIRRSPEDVRADHLLLTGEAKRRITQTMRKPGPMVDRGGNPILDDEGYAIPDENTRMNAVQTLGRLMEREAKLMGADAPAKSIQANVTGSVEDMRRLLASEGVTTQEIDAYRDAILAISAGKAAVPPDDDDEPDESGPDPEDGGE